MDELRLEHPDYVGVELEVMAIESQEEARLAKERGKQRPGGTAPDPDFETAAY